MSRQGFKRSLRVGESILRILAEVLRISVRDPRIDHVTLTGIRLTDDLKQARIFFSIHSPSSEDFVTPEDAQKGLESASGYLKRELAKQMQLRKMPDLIFQYDGSMQQAARIESLLEQSKG